MGVFVGVVLIVAGALTVWLAWVGSQRRLPPNRGAGIRTSWSRSSTEAWYVTHEAAAGALGVGGGTACLAGLAMIAMGGDTALATVAGGIGVGGLLGGILIGTVLGHRAVRDLDA